MFYFLYLQMLMWIIIFTVKLQVKMLNMNNKTAVYPVVLLLVMTAVMP